MSNVAIPYQPHDCPVCGKNLCYSAGKDGCYYSCPECRYSVQSGATLQEAQRHLFIFTAAVLKNQNTQHNTIIQ